MKMAAWPMIEQSVDQKCKRGFGSNGGNVRDRPVHTAL